MKELLYGWVQDIAFYTLLMVIVLHVLPDKNQRKYLQFFMGVVMIILVMSPVLKFTGLERKLDETYAQQTYDQELQEFLRRQEEIEEEYQIMIEEKLEKTQAEIEARETTEAQEVTGQDAKNSSGGGEDIGIERIQIEIGTMEED